MQGMKKLINRLQVSVIKKYLKKFPVVAVVGARQTGKNTLVRDLLKEKRIYLKDLCTTCIWCFDKDKISSIICLKIAHLRKEEKYNASADFPPTQVR